MARTVNRPSIVIARDDLIAALEARRPWAKALDATNRAAHKKSEADYTKAFRASCREASKWSYTTIRKNYGSLNVRRHDMPNCPMSVVVQLDDSLKLIQIDGRRSYTIAPDNQWGGIYWLLTHDENAPNRDVC